MGDPVLVVDPVPVRSGFGGFGGYQPFSAGGGIRLASAAGRPGGAFGVRSSGPFMVLKSAGPPGPPGGPFTRAGGPPGAYGRPSYAAAPPPRTTTTMTTTTFQPSIGLGSITALMSFDSADYDDDFGLESLSYSESSGTC